MHWCALTSSRFIFILSQFYFIKPSQKWGSTDIPISQGARFKALSFSHQVGGEWSQHRKGRHGTTTHRGRPQGDMYVTTQRNHRGRTLIIPSFLLSFMPQTSPSPCHRGRHRDTVRLRSLLRKTLLMTKSLVPKCLHLYRLTHSRSYKSVHIKKYHCSHILYLRHTTGNEKVSQKWPLHHKSGCISAVQHKTHFWWDSKND